MTYPDELPAKVLALVEGEGYSARAAGRAVGVPEDTAVEWVRKAREATQGNKPLMDRWHRRVSKSLDLMERGLDVIEEDESNQLAYKSLQTLNIIAGTGTDKLLKESEKPSIQAQNVTINVYGEPPPQLTDGIIEGEVNDA